MNKSSNTVQKTTLGVKVAVEVFFQPKYSIPFSDQNVFTYHISIANENPFAVQLLRRHWWIWESNGTRRQVRGEGVIGEQPVIQPGDAHRYESFCPIASDIGKMHGIYQMIRLDNQEIFDIEIPEFQLMVPSVEN
ncbi:MAG TPA: Co2+/Mg2+ efflux protein ApaG [Saprospiraceae bacterium]|nr:Co2+/Mg2+ efflux protein ApaG [Saprospiraceae bacterium]HNT20350.1 Co2+/Mg2+ efflux protein ApaG [Saprospiraceae bacterium]